MWESIHQNRWYRWDTWHYQGENSYHLYHQHRALKTEKGIITTLQYHSEGVPEIRSLTTYFHASELKMKVSCWIDSIEQSPSWEADSHSASKKFSAFYGTRRLIPCSQEPATGPYPESEDPVHYFPPYFRKIHSKYSPLRLFLPCVLYHLCFRTKICIHFSSLLCVLQAPPISFSLIWWP